MATANAHIELALPADKVWALIGGFGSLPDWLPYIPHSELREGGRVRRLANPEGAAIVERLMAFDEAQRTYSYAILEAPFPVSRYRSTLRVVPSANEGGSRVEWFGEFTPEGVTNAQASALFQGIYDDGLKALANEIQKRSQ